ncbi:sensor histidine kinase N-terminal domain-containing protein [Candidatus Methylocalor cossyra]|uniref:Two-component sensor kinase N-terminal domain-containing protein n=1 Tax=Candidatus Methylocalor cossyra TaxID=3108543 RepID=A0ABM9NGE7_9GAMM
MRHPGSLRQRLLVLVLSAVGVTWLLVAATAYLAARHELDELLDAHLAQTAAVLMAHVLEEEHEGDLAIGPVPQLHRYARRLAFQVWDQDRLLLRSPSAPSTRLSPLDYGFSRGGAGQGWRVFSARLPGRTALIQVAERSAPAGR